jgi:Uma2 family endonuclease
MATVASALLTADEFGKRPDPGYPEELVRGRIVGMPQPGRRHGQVCGQSYYLIRQYVQEHDAGHVLSNDSGVITERDPDTVRGADVAFYRYARLPRGPLSDGYGPEVPDLIIEVKLPSDRWREILANVVEYLNAGVVVVIVLDPEPQTATIYAADAPTRVLEADAELTIPEILPEFRILVGRFFE